MEPFTIQCSTCQSLIRVRNPKMIGQIVNCPKCNSMLQIIEPRQIRVESHRGVIDSNAMTKEAFAPELEDEYRLAPSPNDEAEANGDAPLIAPPRIDDEPMFQDPFAAQLSAPPLPEQKHVRPQADSNAIQVLAVQRTARRRQALMVAVLGSSGVLLAGLLFAGFLYWYTSNPNSPIAKKDQEARQNASDKKHVGPKIEPGQELTDPLDEPEVSPINPPTTATEGNPETGSVQVGDAPKATESGANEEKNTIGSAIANAISNPNAPDSNAAEQSDAPKNTDADSTSTDSQSPEKLPVAELPDQLKKFENILRKSIEPQFVEDQVLEKAPPTAKDLGLPSSAEARALPAIDVEKQLQFELTGLISPSVSLSKAVSLWVQLSGIPTVVDLDSLTAVGVDQHKSIGQIRIAEAASLAQIGSAIAADVGVDLKTIENRFMAFQASEASIRSQMPSSIKISDLVAEPDQVQWLVKTLEQIFPEYEGKWTVKAEELTVDHTAVDSNAWFWAVRMLESWRAAAGVETQLDKSKFDQSKFVTKFVEPDDFAALNKPLNLTLLNRAPVANLISQITEANGVHAWVDWASVSQRGLGPNTLDFIVAKDRTIRQCLRDIAQKYSVVVACEDDKSLVITTTEVYQGQPRLYVLPSEGRTVEQWKEELQPLTPATEASAQPVKAFLTPDGKFVIVRCCRPRIRFDMRNDNPGN